MGVTLDRAPSTCKRTSDLKAIQMTQLGGPEVLHLVGWSAAGQLRTPAVQALPQPDAAEAHPLLETGATTGKVVLKP